MPTIEQLTKALQADPDDAFLLYGLALEYAKVGQHEAAIDHFDKAIAADPANAYHYYHKARSLEAMDRLAEAVETLKRGCEAAMEDPHPKARSELAGYLEVLQNQIGTS